MVPSSSRSSFVLFYFFTTLLGCCTSYVRKKSKFFLYVRFHHCYSVTTSVIFQFFRAHVVKMLYKKEDNPFAKSSFENSHITSVYNECEQSVQKRLYFLKSEVYPQYPVEKCIRLKSQKSRTPSSHPPPLFFLRFGPNLNTVCKARE